MANRRLERRIPPLLVTLLAAAAMGVAAEVAPGLGVDLPGRQLLGVLLAVLGAGTALLGVGEFRRAGTSVNPLRLTSVQRVVTGGIYRYSRNPMYFGFALALTGWAVWLSNALAFAGVPALVAFLNHFQIDPEERLLLERFGDEYGDYMAKVRRWIGRR